MRKYILFFVCIIFFFYGCEKEVLEGGVFPPDNVITLLFVDQDGNNLIESKHLNISNIKMVSYQDGEELLHSGEKHVHSYPETNQVNHQCFRINENSMYLELNMPIQERLTSRTYFRIKDYPIDTLYTIYNKERGIYNKEEVYLNGKLIWNDIDRGIPKIVVNIEK